MPVANRWIDCVVWGEVLWDLYPDQARLGGAPSNVAFHLAQLGAAVALISRVGDDARGHEARARLAAAGVEPSAIQIDAARATGEVAVTIVDGEPRYRLVDDRAWQHIELDDRGRELVAGCRALVIGSLALREPTARAALAAALELLPADAIVVCDVNLRPGPAPAAEVQFALEVATVVKANEHELAEIGRLLDGDPIARLFGREVDLIALTRGARGAALISRGDTVEHPGFAATPGGDSVGCGDAFVAVLTHLLVAGAPPAAIVAAANRYAAAIAGVRGATPTVPPAVVAEIAAITRRT